MDDGSSSDEGETIPPSRSEYPREDDELKEIMPIRDDLKMTSIIQGAIADHEMSLVKRPSSRDLGGPQLINLIKCDHLAAPSPPKGKKIGRNSASIASPLPIRRSRQESSIESISRNNKAYRVRKDFKKSLSIGGPGPKAVKIGSSVLAIAKSPSPDSDINKSHT